jgi:putative Mg2+ transporter-C (MgtC) family protein
VTIFYDALLKLLLAMIVGGLIGFEREYRDKAAGLRTIIFICLGATVFTMLSLRLGEQDDITRIAANVVSGVGFLGAGAILQSSGRVTGLTTASTIWLAAALGMGIGGGNYLLVGIAVVLVMLVLWVFPKLERRVGRLRDTRTYEIACSHPEEMSGEMERLFQSSGLEVRTRHHYKRDDKVVWILEAGGHPAAHRKLTHELAADDRVIELGISA